LRDDGLERALSLARKRGTDLLTIFPSMTATSRFDRLLVPFFLQITLIGVSMRKINDPENEAAGGFAPFFLFRRTVYEALGGHAAVRGDRFADSTLAQRVKDRGYRILLANGTKVAVLQGQSRLRDIWTSWSQSFSETIEGDYRQASLLAMLVLALFAAPWAIVAWAVITLLASSTPASSSPWLGVVIIGSACILLGLLHRRALSTLLDLDDSLSWLQPIAAVLTAAMILTSAVPLEDGWLSRVSRAGKTGGNAPGRVGARAARGS
ncbi:MAG: glycosyltransferase, partial [Acidobacteriota bacterium]